MRSPGFFRRTDFQVRRELTLSLEEGSVYWSWDPMQALSPTSLNDGLGSPSYGWRSRALLEVYDGVAFFARAEDEGRRSDQIGFA